MMIPKWIKKAFSPSFSNDSSADLHELLNDDVGEIEALALAQQAGEFSALSKQELLAIAQRQARTIQAQKSELCTLQLRLSKHVEFSEAERNADSRVDELAVANKAIQQLTKQLEDSRIARERDLSRLGQEKAEYELRLLNKADPSKHRN